MDEKNVTMNVEAIFEIAKAMMLQYIKDVGVVINKILDEESIEQKYRCDGKDKLTLYAFNMISQMSSSLTKSLQEELNLEDKFEEQK